MTKSLPAVSESKIILPINVSESVRTVPYVDSLERNGGGPESINSAYVGCAVPANATIK